MTNNGAVRTLLPTRRLLSKGKQGAMAGSGNSHDEAGMSFQMTSLLIHSTWVPGSARDALRVAAEAPPEDRDALLRSAAGILHREAELECSDALELVGLEADGGCGG